MILFRILIGKCESSLKNRYQFFLSLLINLQKENLKYPFVNEFLKYIKNFDKQMWIISEKSVSNFSIADLLHCFLPSFYFIEALYQFQNFLLKYINFAILMINQYNILKSFKIIQRIISLIFMFFCWWRWLKKSKNYIFNVSKVYLYNFYFIG